MLNWVNDLFKVFYVRSPIETEESDCKHQDTWVMYLFLYHLTEHGGFVT